MEEADSAFTSDMQAIMSLCPVLTAEEEQTLVIMYLDSKGPQAEMALRRLELAAVRLILGLATKLKGERSLSESFSAGRSGWDAALARYDGSIGSKFSTYSTWWIRRALAQPTN